MENQNVICVVARFDAAADAQLRRLKGIAGELAAYDESALWPPHITVAAYENLDEAALCRWTEEYAESRRPFKVSFPSLGVFCNKAIYSDTDAIYAVPAHSLELTEFYYGFHGKYDEFCGKTGWVYSAAFGQPALHSTITICKSEEFERVFMSLYGAFAPIGATVSALEVYSLPMKLIARYELRG